MQEQKGFKLAKKLASNNVEFEGHKMNVSLAAYTLSASVAHSMYFMKLPEFLGSEATVCFTKIIYRLLDLLNSRNPHGQDFKN